ncbi:hypothetical protein [Streptomyces roseolus]|uniref:hypothetical protein n=1 Tax=Streptomyces roseolus TaxID=67358 RepID=UPI0036E0BCF6
MPDEPVNTSIQAKYTEQLAADLAANQAEQATLTVRLNRLKEEKKWLTTMLDSLPAAAAEPVGDAAPDGTGAEEAAVPQPRAEKPAGTTAVKKTPASSASLGSSSGSVAG